MSVEIFVPWMGPSSNSCYAGKHWAIRKKEADAGHLVTGQSFKGVGLIEGPVLLNFSPIVGKGKRRFDPSNYSYSVKIIEDGLVLAGVIAGDGPDQVSFIGISSPVRGDESGFFVEILQAKKSPATNHRA